MNIEGSGGLVAAANCASYIRALLQPDATKVYPSAGRREPVPDPLLTPIGPHLTRPVSTEVAVLHAGDAARMINNAGISTGPVLGYEAGLRQGPEVRCSGVVLVGQRRRRLGYGDYDFL